MRTGIVLAVLAALASPVGASVTYSPFFVGVNDVGGTPIADGTAYLIIDIDGDGFDGASYLNDPLPGDTFLPDPDDVLIGTAIGTAAQIIDGDAAPLALFQVDDIAGYQPGLQFFGVWFDVPFGDTEPGIGAEYGIEDAGLTVSDGGTATPVFFGNATMTTVSGIANITWGGGGGDNNWTTDANWVGGTAPQAGELLTFDGSTRINNTNDLAPGTEFASLTFAAGADGFTLGGNGILLSADGAITNNAANTQTINLDLDTDGDATFDAASGDLDFGGAVTITSDTLTITGDNNTSLTGALAGAGDVNKTGGGTLIFDADATGFTGDLGLASGTLQVGANASVDADSTYTFSGGTILNQSGGQVTLPGDTTIDGDFTVADGDAFDVDGAVTLSGGMRTLTIDDPDNPFVIDGIVSGDGAADDDGIIKQGPGKLTLNNANTFAGGVTLDAGAVGLGSDNALGTGPLTLNSGATIEATQADRDVANPLTINDSFTVGDGSGSDTLTFSGPATVTGDASVTIANVDGTTFAGALGLGANAFTVQADNPVDITGDITGDNTLAKTGADTLTLAGDNAGFTGNLDIDNGQVDLNGNLGGSATIDNATLNLAADVSAGVTVNAGANLTGAGTLGSLDVVGGTVTPGASLGTLDITGDVTFDGSSTYAVEVQAALDGGTASDTLAVGGTALFNSGATIDVSQFGGGSAIDISEVFTIVTASDFGATDINQINLNSTVAGTSFELNISGGTDLQLLVNPTVTWTGAGNGTEWADPTNWDNDPQLNDQDLGSQVLVFGANGTSGTLNADLGLGGVQDFAGIGGITFADQSGPFTLQGGDLSFIDAANITNNSANTATIDNNLVAGADNLTVNANAGDFDINGDIDLSSGGDANFAGDANTTVDGIISGSGGVRKSGDGTLNLTNDNIYSGDTTLAGGTLNLTGSVDGGVVVDDGTLILGNDNAIDAAQTLTVNGGALQSDDDARNIGNDLIVGGDFTVNAGNNLTLSGGVDLGGATRAVTIDDTQTTTLSGIVSNGGLTKLGGGFLVLQGTNTFTGDLTVNGGRVQANAADAIEDSVAVIVGGSAQFDLLSSGETIGSLAGDAGAIVDLNAQTLTLGGNDADTDFAGQILGGTPDSKVVKVGTGNFTLSGGNTHNGTTAVQEGTLTLTGSLENDLIVDGGTAVLGNDDGLGVGATLVINSGSIASDDDARNVVDDVTVTGDFAVGGTHDLELSGGIDFGDLAGATRTVTVDNTAATVFSGTIDASNGVLAKAGPGQLNLTADNTLASITADVQLDAGTLGLGDDNALGSGGFIVNGGAVLAVGGPVVIDNTVTVNGDFTIGGTNDFEIAGGDTVDFGDLAGGTTTVTVDNTATTTWSATVNASNGTIAKAGDGTLVINADNTGSLDADFQIDGGTLTVQNGAALADDNAVVVNAGGALDVDDDETIDALTTAAAATVNLDATLTVGNAGGASDIAGAVTGIGGLTLLDDTTISGNTNYTGDTTVSGGALTLSGSIDGKLDLNGGSVVFAADNPVGNGANIEINDAGSVLQSDATHTVDADVVANTDITVAGDNDLTLSGVLSGADADLNKNGDGDLTLSGANTRTGNAAVNAGSLTVAGGDALDDAGLVDLAAADAAFLLNDDETIGSLQGVAGSTVNLGTSALTIAGSASTTFAGDIVNQDGDLSVDLDTATDPNASLTLEGNNTYNGDTNILDGTLIANGADVQFDGLTVGNAIPDTSEVFLNDGGVLELLKSEVIALLSDGPDGGGVVEAGAFDLIITGDNPDPFSGTINSDTVEIEEGGSFETDGDIDGDVDNDGTFLSNGLIDGNVLNRGRFGGNSNITGNFSNQPGGTHAPGGSIGTTIVAGDYDEAGFLEIELNGAADGQMADLVDVGGIADLLDGATIVILPEDADDDGEPDTEDGNVEPGQVFTILTADGGINVPDAGDPQTLGLTIDNQILDQPFSFLFNDDMTELMLQALVLDDVELQPQAFEAVFASHLDSVRVANLGLSAYLNGRRLGVPGMAMAEGNAPAVGSMLAFGAEDPEMLAMAMQAAEENADDEPTDEQRFDVTTTGSNRPQPTVADERWGAFVRGIGVFQDTESNGDAAGYQVDTGGFLGGVDYATDNNMLIGMMIGYQNSSVSLELNRGSHDIDTIRVGPYLSWNPAPWFVDASLTYGYHNIDSDRNAMGQALESDHAGHEVTAFLRAGRDFEMDSGLRITPEAALQYTYLYEESFSETGGSNALNVDDVGSDSLRSRLGVTLSYVIDRGQMAFIPEVFAGWEHEFLDPEDRDAVFVNNGNPSNFNPGSDDDDSYVLAGGLTALIRENLSAFIRYEGTFSDDDTIHGITGGVRLRF